MEGIFALRQRYVWHAQNGRKEVEIGVEIVSVRSQ